PPGFGTLAQGVPVPSTNVATVPAPGGGVTLANASGAFRAVALDFQASYLRQFNLILEKQFGNNVVSVGYVGQRGRNLVMDIPDINRALPSGTGTPNPKPLT